MAVLHSHEVFLSKPLHLYYCMSPDPKGTSVDDEKQSLVDEIDLKFKQKL